jgi:hypothetical protein
VLVVVQADGREGTLLLYGVKKATCWDRKWPVTWVGVAGFEPAASSSRSNLWGCALAWAKPNRGFLIVTCANALSESR